MKILSDSITNEQLTRIGYPVIGSPKVDGIRGLVDDKVYSASLKPIGNKFIQKVLSQEMFKGLDGELVVGLPYIEHEEDDVFNRTTGPVRRGSGEPDFTFYVFDDFSNPFSTYEKRWIEQLADDPDMYTMHPRVKILEMVVLNSPQEVIDYEEKCVNAGYEGAMIRRPSSPYKEGRTTFKEEYGFKRKPFEDDEAIILYCFEQEENQNEKVTNELGTSTRSGHKENKVGKNTLGGFCCKSIKYGWEFNVGTIKGGTLSLRQTIWEQWLKDPESIKGKIITYKFQKTGTLEKPRQPIMKGFRDKDDMTDY